VQRILRPRLLPVVMQRSRFSILLQYVTYTIGRSQLFSQSFGKDCGKLRFYHTFNGHSLHFLPAAK